MSALPLPIELESRRVRDLKEAVESWAKRHEEAMTVRDFEDIVWEACRVTDYPGEIVKRHWRLLDEGKLENPDAVGLSMLKILLEYTNLLIRITEVHDRIVARGYDIENEGELDRATDVVEELVQRVLIDWPFSRRKEAEDLLAASEAVAGRGVADILKALDEERAAAERIAAMPPIDFDKFRELAQKPVDIPNVE